MIRVIVAIGLCLATAAPAAADPQPPAPDPGAPVIEPVAATEAAPPADPAVVISAAPVSTETPDGATLTISSRDETQLPAAPLTTAISSREYVVGGVFTGSVAGGGDSPAGVFEVGYQIGCGIDMSTSNGVSLTGTAGISPGIGFIDIVPPFDNFFVPSIGANLGGAVTVGLKPGIIESVPVTKKRYTGAAPWISIDNFRVHIDGCVGESFIRSYAILTKSTDEGEAILSWYGTTKAV